MYVCCRRCSTTIWLRAVIRVRLVHVKSHLVDQQHPRSVRPKGTQGTKWNHPLSAIMTVGILGMEVVLRSFSMRKVTGQVAAWALDLPPKLRRAIGPTDERPQQSAHYTSGSSRKIVASIFSGGCNANMVWKDCDSVSSLELSRCHA